MATTGSDANPGTIGSPWRTLQASLPKLVAGDVLGIQPGTYSDGNVFGAIADGTASNPITVTSVDPDNRAVIDANWRVSNASWWRWQKLKITNPTPVTDAGVAITDPATDLVRTRVMSITGGNDNIIDDCEIYDSRYAGLLIGRASSTSEIPHRYTIRNSYIHDTDRVGFYFNVSRYGTGHLIERNVIAHCDSECLKVGWGGSDLGPGTTNYETFGAGEVTVRYNTMYDGGDAGVFIVAEPGGLHDVLAYRNIFQSIRTTPNYVVRYDSVEGWLGDKVYITDNWAYGATLFSQDFDDSATNVSHEAGNVYGTNPALDIDGTWVPAHVPAQAYGRFA
jgi:hypothetical protein